MSKFLNPKSDLAFKKIFATEKNKDILIHFINDVLEFPDKQKIVEVEFLSPVLDPEVAYEKQSIVDVLCKDVQGTTIIVEMQVSPQKGFEKRAQYYAAKVYSRQLKRGSDVENSYLNLKEVIFIAISDYIIFKDKATYKSKHIILDKKSFEHDLRDFSFTFIELPKFEKTAINDLNTMLEKWCFFFKYADETTEQDMKKIAGNDIIIERAYEAVNQFNWTEQELIRYEAEIKRIMDNNASEAYFKEELMEKIKEEGKKEGKEEGKEEEKREIAVKLLQIGISLKDIIKATNLSAEEINKIKRKEESD